MLSSTSVHYLPDAPEHDAAVAMLADEAFGPGRFARAAERVRERAPHSRNLSFVAAIGPMVVAAVRQTPIQVGGRPALMLGPLVVRPVHKGFGIGRALMSLAAVAAHATGERAIVLVGDSAYYGPLGYASVPAGSIRFPGPVDARRVLARPLADGALEGLAGRIAPR